MPEFLELLLEAKARARKRGADYHTLEGFRSYGRSHFLYGQYLAGKGGRAAPAGKSSHNFGLASDECLDADLDKTGLQPSWKEESYEILGEEVTRLGLHWGAGYGDRPHVSWPGFVTAKELEPLDKMWRSLDGTQAQRLHEIWTYVKSKAPIK
jgi:peptidoglycan L-alanyl-D-glutamate endopeptidase CwlK